MSRILRFAIIALLFLPLELHAWSTAASKTAYRVRFLDQWVTSYREEHGKLPADETFRAAMADENDILADLRTDLWKNEYVYRVPGKQGEYELYSRGANGIDDGGMRDDISASAGVSDGFYWKSHWPLGRRILWASAFGLVAVVVLRLFRPGHLSAPLLGLCCGGAIACGSLLLMHPGRVPSYNTPLAASLFAGILISIAFAIRLAMRFKMRREPRS